MAEPRRNHHSRKGKWQQKSPNSAFGQQKRRRFTSPPSSSGHAGLVDEYVTADRASQRSANRSRSDATHLSLLDHLRPRAVTTTLVTMTLPLNDPITLYLYGLVWEKAIERLPRPPHSTSGPVTKEEHLALISTLVDFSAGLETNVLTATYYACQFKVSQAEIGRACGISRQAVRQRLAKATAAKEAHNRQHSYWDYDYDYGDLEYD